MGTTCMIQLISVHLRVICRAVVLMGLFTMTAQAATPACGTTLTNNTKLVPTAKPDSDISSKISGVTIGATQFRGMPRQSHSTQV